jgi:hypothetical protein
MRKNLEIDCSNDLSADEIQSGGIAGPDDFAQAKEQQ